MLGSEHAPGRVYSMTPEAYTQGSGRSSDDPDASLYGDLGDAVFNGPDGLTKPGTLKNSAAKKGEISTQKNFLRTKIKAGTDIAPLGGAVVADFDKPGHFTFIFEERGTPVRWTPHGMNQQLYLPEGSHDDYASIANDRNLPDTVVRDFKERILSPSKNEPQYVPDRVLSCKYYAKVSSRFEFHDVKMQASAAPVDLVEYRDKQGPDFFRRVFYLVPYRSRTERHRGDQGI
ncbi:MAG: hypothetical protein SGILL_004347 [Bacillariaceae sp.]